MANPKWEETQPVEAPQGSAPKWEETQPIEEAQPPTSIPEAAALGLTDLAGFGPRIAAAAHTAMDATSGTKGLKELWDEYNHKHEEIRNAFERAKKDHPYVYGGANLAGTGAALAAAGPAALTTGGLAAAGALMGAGQSQDLTNVPDAAKNAAMGAGLNLVGGKAIEAAAPYVEGALSSGVKSIAGALGNKAEKYAVKATGATGAQSAKFADDTGRQLLDRKIVNFGDSPADIAANANTAMEKSGEGISQALNDKLQGTTVDRNTVLDYIRTKIRSLSGDESQVGLVKKLKNESRNIQAQIDSKTKNVTMPIAEDIPEASNVKLNIGKPEIQEVGLPHPDAIDRRDFAAQTKFSDFQSMGEELNKRKSLGIDADLAQANSSGYNPYDPNIDVPVSPITKTGQIIDSTVPISQAADIKRGYQAKVNWKSPNPDVIANNANTTVSDAYRQAVEDAATKADPVVGAQFKADNETYHLLKPIREAAEKREATLNQSPHGGLLDAAWGGAGSAVGAMVGGPVGAVVGGASGLAAKTLRPRYASMAAVSADKLSSIVSASPHLFGKYASVLTSAAARGATSLNATDYLLQQRDPAYRDQRDKVFNPKDEPNILSSNQ